MGGNDEVIHTACPYDSLRFHRKDCPCTPLKRRIFSKHRNRGIGVPHTGDCISLLWLIRAIPIVNLLFRDAHVVCVSETRL